MNYLYAYIALFFIYHHHQILLSITRITHKLISQQSHSNKVLIRIDGIETFLDHPNHDFLICSMRKVSQKPEKINTVEELCGCNFPFSQLSYPFHSTLYFLKKNLFLIS